MTYKTITELAKVAIEREREKQAIEELESENKQKQEEELLALRGEQLRKLLPSATWVELGLDLNSLARHEETLSLNDCIGKVSFEFEGTTYEGSTQLVAQYYANLVEQTPIGVTLHIGVCSTRLDITDGEQPRAQDHIQQANQRHLSDLLVSFICDEYMKLQDKQKQRVKKAHNDLASSKMTASQCEAFITKMETADNLGISEELIEQLLESAKEQLPRLKKQEADKANDKALLERINREALAYEEDIATYQKRAKVWATETTTKYWQPFDTYVATFSVSSSVKESRCLTDEADERGYYDAIGSQGDVTKKRFLNLVMWERQEHTELPQVSKAAVGHLRIWCDEYVANLPPTTDKELLAEIKATKPKEPKKWRRGVRNYVTDFADQTLANQLEKLLKHWFDDEAAIGEFRRNYLNWFDD